MSDDNKKQEEKFTEEYIENAKLQINKLFFDRIGGLLEFSDDIDNDNKEKESFDPNKYSLNLTFQEKPNDEDKEDENTIQPKNIYSEISITKQQPQPITTTSTTTTKTTITTNESYDEEEEEEYYRIKSEYIKISKKYFELKEKRNNFKRNNNNNNNKI